MRREAVHEDVDERDRPRRRGRPQRSSAVSTESRCDAPQNSQIACRPTPLVSNVHSHVFCEAVTLQARVPPEGNDKVNTDLPLPPYL